MDSSNEFHPAYVLHTKPYRETSLIVDFFTPKLGRVTAVARGASKSKSTRHLFQPFIPIQVSVFGRSELKTLGKIELSGQGFTVVGARLYLAFYINELLVRLLQYGDEQIHLFSAYIGCLENLSDTSSDEAAALRQFELQLLSALGYGLNFSHVANTNEPINPSAEYHFVPLLGFVELNSSSDRQNVISGGQILGLDDSILANSKLMKFVTRAQLGALLGDKPLNSRLLYQQFLSEKNKR